MSADALAGGETAKAAAVTDRMRQWAHRSAADYLGKYASSTSNLRQVMLRRASRKHPEIGRAGAALLAEEAVAFCRGHAFLDDSSYAGMKVRIGVRKGFSRRRIAAGLGAKGIDAETLAAALVQSDDLAAAVAFARRRRIGPWRNGALDPDRRRKEAGALGRNGFGPDIVRQILDMPLEEAEDVVFTPPDPA